MGRLLLLAMLLAASATADAAERRCGWFSNPSPANWYLIDRDGEWIIGEQGGYQIPDKSWDVMPDMRSRGWLKTNVDYGYGCACMKVQTDRKTMHVLEIIAAKPVSLRQCRADRRLPRP
jgi:hypothetical protein